jgi:hypothetical protein
MSATAPSHDSLARAASTAAMAPATNKVAKNDAQTAPSNYKGFVAGVFSGVSKLTGQFYQGYTHFT